MIELLEKPSRSFVFGLLIAMLLVGTVSANAALPPPDPVLQQAFHELPADGVRVLSDEQMREVEGKLWPYIATVVTLDLTMASFFWGVYVPFVTTGGACTFCTLTPLVQQH